MLNYNKCFIFHISAVQKMTNIYLKDDELEDLLFNLTPTQINIYTYFKYAPLNKPKDITYFSDEQLAKKFNVSVLTIQKGRSILKNKGYLLLFKIKDERNKTILRIIVGKDEVEIYNLGFTASISDYKAYKKLQDNFPFNDKTLSLTDRKKYAEQAQIYYDNNKNEFK